MQAACPNCSNKIVIDDSRVPDRAFSVKCPKCQNTVKFPGKGAGAPAAAAAPPPPPPPEPPADAAAGFNADELRAQMMAQLRREMSGGGEGGRAGERALVALPDRGQAGNVTLVLTRLGYSVDTLDDWAEGARLLEQGVYQVVVTAPVAGPQGKESLYQKALRMNPESRRPVFIALVADNLKTGDGTQAFVLQADLVLSSRDAATADAVFRSTLAERTRVYQCFADARRRADAAAGY